MNGTREGSRCICEPTRSSQIIVIGRWNDGLIDRFALVGRGSVSWRRRLVGSLIRLSSAQLVNKRAAVEVVRCGLDPA